MKRIKMINKRMKMRKKKKNNKKKMKKKNKIQKAQIYKINLKQMLRLSNFYQKNNNLSKKNY